MEANNTAQSFSDKWHINSQLALANTLNEDSDIFKWITKRNGFENGTELKSFLFSKKRILNI